MVKIGMVVNIADNSGAFAGRCIKILGSTNRKQAAVGDTIIVTICSAAVNSKIKLGTLHRGLIIRTKFPFHRTYGLSYKFHDNAILLVNQRMAPKAKRIKGPILKETALRFDFIASLSPYMI